MNRVIERKYRHLVDKTFEMIELEGNTLTAVAKNINVARSTMTGWVNGRGIRLDQFLMMLAASDIAFSIELIHSTGDTHRFSLSHDEIINMEEVK